VDGQQRSAAMREAALDDFPVAIVAFVTAEASEQREQFLLVNSAKPLPKALVYELLPETTALLAAPLERRRYPARLLARLNADADSPLRGRIRTTTNPQGVIQDNSILKMLENSLSDGAMYHSRVVRAHDEVHDGAHDAGPIPPAGTRHTAATADEAAMLRVCKAFWATVADAFPEAWALPPRRSRLTHGAGVVALGLLMDTGFSQRG
jgi:DGQHR domain-containing protein